MQVIEVCCGAGGMSLGLSRAGFQIGLAIDFWTEALDVYRHNIRSPSLLAGRSKHAVGADLSDLLAVVPKALLRTCDIVVGSPPCQDFSSAGSRIEGTRADVTLAFAIFITALRPRWVLMENVPETKGSKAYGRARKILKRSGYGLIEKVLDASRYGVAQARERFIMVGRLDEADGFLDSALVAAAAERRTTVRDLLGDGVGMHPGGDHPPETRVFFMRPFPGYPGVRSIDAPCPTITSKSGGKAHASYVRHKEDIAPPDNVPALNWDQFSLIQGFPTTWDWDPAPTKDAKAKMIANAVPAPLAEAIGRVIMEREQGTSIPEIEPTFVQWLTRVKKLRGAALRNRKSCLNRGRKLLRGRILTDTDAEIALLERNQESSALSASVKSDIRLALRSHAEWRTLPQVRRAKTRLRELAATYENDEPLEGTSSPRLKIGFGSTSG
jgi:DNA (cytosine-5)-methyltransferase 1